jgi:hypothetical protein
MVHCCNRCFQIFKTDELFKKHKSENLCFNLDLPNMHISLETCIPANILKLLIESQGIGVLKLTSTYPKNNNEPPSQEGFDEFRSRYHDQLYPDIEQISSDDEEDDNKKKMKKK